ncbi:hypothetical protein LINPERHAP1_LOCUS5910 [Linum perenne]
MAITTKMRALLAEGTVRELDCEGIPSSSPELAESLAFGKVSNFIMEKKSSEPDVDTTGKATETIESNIPRNDMKEASSKRNVHFESRGHEVGELINSNAEDDEHSCGDVNMEASISIDDVMRAGGFGARDDIGSVLPVASDSTDFEAMILDAKDYEEPQKVLRRPGLGWTDAAEESPSSAHP